MDIQTTKEFLETQNIDNLQNIIVLAQQRIQQIRENQEANRETIKVLSTYAEKLDVIQDDVESIKHDITTINSKAP